MAATALHLNSLLFLTEAEPNVTTCWFCANKVSNEAPDAPF